MYTRQCAEVCSRSRKGDGSISSSIIMRQSAVLQAEHLVDAFLICSAPPPPPTRSPTCKLTGRLADIDVEDAGTPTSNFGFLPILTHSNQSTHPAHFPFSIRLTCVSEDATSQANPIPKSQAEIMATASTPKIITLEEGWNEEIKKKVSRNVPLYN